jgi:hypothetical protein
MLHSRSCVYLIRAQIETRHASHTKTVWPVLAVFSNSAQIQGTLIPIQVKGFERCMRRFFHQRTNGSK